MSERAREHAQQQAVSRAPPKRLGPRGWPEATFKLSSLAGVCVAAAAGRFAAAHGVLCVRVRVRRRGSEARRGFAPASVAQLPGASSRSVRTPPGSAVCVANRLPACLAAQPIRRRHCHAACFCSAGCAGPKT